MANKITGLNGFCPCNLVILPYKPPLSTPQPQLGGSSQLVKWLITNGDRKSPNWGNGPLLNGLNGLQMGVTNYLLTGMIIQELPPILSARWPRPWCWWVVPFQELSTASTVRNVLDRSWRSKCRQTSGIPPGEMVREGWYPRFCGES